MAVKGASGGFVGSIIHVFSVSSLVPAESYGYISHDLLILSLKDMGKFVGIKGQQNIAKARTMFLIPGMHCTFIWHADCGLLLYCVSL